MMRNIELPKFANAVVMDLEAVFLTALKNGDCKKLSQKKNYNNITVTTLITANVYGDFQYVFELDEHFRAYRVDKNKVKSQENDREHLMTSVLASPQQWEKMKADKTFSMMASHSFYVYNISLLKKMMIDLELPHFDDKYQYFDEDMATHSFGFKADIDVIFEAATRFKKKLSICSDEFHKHVFGSKEIITHTNTSACMTSFILYERDTETGVIKIYQDLENNVDEEKFPHDLIIIGKYPNIVKHYIENSDPCVILENGVFVKNDNPYVAHISSFNAHSLSEHFEIEKDKPYDVTSLASVMEYMTYDNINLLYTYGLWSSDSKWKKNDAGRYYIAFDEDLLSTYKRDTQMVHGSTDYGYISIYSYKSPMYKLPEKGEIEPEWLDLVVKAFTFVSKNHKKLPVCEAKEKDIQAIKDKLLARNCI